MNGQLKNQSCPEFYKIIMLWLENFNSSVLAVVSSLVIKKCSYWLWKNKQINVLQFTVIKISKIALCKYIISNNVLLRSKSLLCMVCIYWQKKKKIILKREGNYLDKNTDSFQENRVLEQLEVTSEKNTHQSFQVCSKMLATCKISEVHTNGSL